LAETARVLLPNCFRGPTVWKQKVVLMPKEESTEWVAGAPEEIRTPDPQIRSLVLYPAELRALDSAAENRTAAQRHSYRLGYLLARVADASGASGLCAAQASASFSMRMR
jgi:hypothetical protein